MMPKRIFNRIQDTPEVLGCMDTSACNFNELANTDDGSCEYESCAPSLHPCGDPLTYQGYAYATVQIGEDCWFAENLRTLEYANGDSIPSNLSADDWVSATTGAVAVYGEGSSTCFNNCDEEWSLNEYGRLYNFYAVSDDRGLCPNGWHGATNSEWELAVAELGGSLTGSGPTISVYSGVGIDMRASYGWWPDYLGTNASGFGGLPGGYRSSGSFDNSGWSGYWWGSPTSESSPSPWSLSIFWDLDDIRRDPEAAHFGASVRCVLADN